MDNRRGFLGKLIGGLGALGLASRLPTEAKTEVRDTLAPRELWSSPRAKDSCILQHRESFSGNRMTDVRVVTDEDLLRVVSRNSHEIRRRLNVR